MFGSKRALFLEALSRAYERVSAEFERAAGTVPDGRVSLIVLGDAYRRLLVQDQTVALVILQGYAASADESVRIEAARHHTDLERKITALSGADPFEIRTFISTGLILTVSAALGLRGKRQDEASAASLLNSIGQRAD
jgi:AcrR family transcriptional regulator